MFSSANLPIVFGILTVFSFNAAFGQLFGSNNNNNPLNALLGITTTTTGAPQKSAKKQPLPSGNYRCEGELSQKLGRLAMARLRTANCATSEGAVTAAGEIKSWIQTQYGGTYQVMVIQHTPDWDWAFQTEGLTDLTANGEEEQVYCEIDGTDQQDNTCFVAAFLSSRQPDGFIKEEK